MSAVERHTASRAYNLARARGWSAGMLWCACTERASVATSARGRAILSAMAARALSET